MHKGWHGTLTSIAVLAVVATLGCIPKYIFWGDQQAVTEVCFTTECELVTANGKAVNEIHVGTWDRITFCNNSDGSVTVVLPGGREWIGRDHFRLNPGESVTLRVRIALPGEYSYRFFCRNSEGEETGNGGGPIIKDPPGGP